MTRLALGFFWKKTSANNFLRTDLKHRCCRKNTFWLVQDVVFLTCIQPKCIILSSACYLPWWFLFCGNSGGFRSLNRLTSDPKLCMSFFRIFRTHVFCLRCLHILITKGNMDIGKHFHYAWLWRTRIFTKTSIFVI